MIFTSSRVLFRAACLLWSAFLLISVLHLQAQTVAVMQAGTHDDLVIRAAGAKGRWVGFDALAGGQRIASARFTSLGLIHASAADIRTNGITTRLIFAGLTAEPNCGLTLANSRVEVELAAHRYPVVRFELHIAAFDAAQWQSVMGRAPFHFLALTLPAATLWHSQGCLNPVTTPANGWSAMPPLAAFPLPAIGLWSPKHSRYAAWNFLPTRLIDNSERGIAAGYCALLTPALRPDALPAPLLNGKRTPPGNHILPPPSPARPANPALRKPHLDADNAARFVALVYPQGASGYRQPAYPHNGDTVQSWAALTLETSLPASDTPNRLLWQSVWQDEALRNLLPRVPAVNDLTWIPPDMHLKTLADTVCPNTTAGSADAARINALLDTYSTFCGSLERHSDALQALEQAQTAAYRHLNVWAGDNNRGDSLDPSFLPSAGQDTGAAAAGSDALLSAIARTAVTTGDPILLWAVQGVVSRWPALFQNVKRDAFADYTGTDFTAGLSFAAGSPFGPPGSRAAAGILQPFTLFDPAAGTSARIVAGAAAMLAFRRGSSAVRITDYRCTGPGICAFTVRTDSPATSLTVTFPNADLQRSPVFIVRHRIIKIPLQDGQGLRRDPSAPSSLIVADVQDGDTVLIGEPGPASTANLPAILLPSLAEKPEFPAASGPFQPIRLFLNTSVRRDWTHHDTFAALPVGVQWFNDVPFVIGAGGALRNALPEYVLPHAIDSAGKVFALYEPANAGADDRLPLLLLDNGGIAPPAESAPQIAWQAWPPVFTSRLSIAVYTIPTNRRVVAIDTNGLRLFALTTQK